MRNVDKYKDELIRMANESNIVQVSCRGDVIQDESKANGLFCSKRASSSFIKWLYEECTFKLSALELEILRYFYEDGYGYIARDKDNDLFLYKILPVKSIDSWVIGCDEPCRSFQTLNDFRNLFSFVKWEDEEPTSIKEILDNCEVRDDD